MPVGKFRGIVASSLLVLVSVTSHAAQDDPPPPEDQIPGDQFEPEQIPGDQFDPERIPGDQFEREQIPGDQFDPERIPGDQFEPGPRVPPGASDGNLIAHFPLDGSPANTVGEAGRIVAPKGVPPRVVDGRVGRAYQFGDGALIAAPLDIDFQTHPQLTITAWVRLPADREQAGGYLVSSGSGGAAPALMLSHDNLRAALGRSRPVFYSAIAPETWTFVAAAWDFSAGSVRLHTGDDAETKTARRLDAVELAKSGRNQPEQPPPDEEEAEPRRWIFIGARDFSGSRAAQRVAIDDVRIFSGALGDQQIAALQDAGPEERAARATRSAPQQRAPTDGEPRHTVVFDGTTAPGRTRYTLRATGPLEPVDGQLDGMTVTINTDDTLDGTGHAARGYVGSARDGYRVYGEIESINLLDPDAATVYVDGEVWGEERVTRNQALMPSEGGADGDSREGTRTSASGQARGSGTLNVEQGERSSTVPRVSIDTSDDEQRSDVSGLEGPIELKVDLRRYAMHTLRWYEESDRPCQVVVLGYAPGVEPYEIAQAGTEICNGPEGNARSLKTVSLKSRNAAVRRLRSCTSDPAEARLKGIELSGILLTDDGEFESGTRFSNRQERPNCSDWHSEVSCPNDRVATGVVLHARQNNQGNYFIRGMQLICRALGD